MPAHHCLRPDDGKRITGIWKQPADPVIPENYIRDGFGLHELRLIERPHVHVALGGATKPVRLSVIKVFETASRANGGRLWLVWLMTLRGSPLVLQAA